MRKTENDLASIKDSFFFLCCAESDKVRAKKLHKKLLEDKINVLFDNESIIAGQNKKTTISKLVKKATAIIICLSKNATEEEGEIQYVIRKAIEVSQEKTENAIFIIPVKFEVCEMPYALSTLQSANLFEENGYANLIKSINRAEENMVSIRQAIKNAESKIEFSSNRKLDFLLVGRSGVGKSSTINSLMGKKVSEVNPFEAQTQEILRFENEVDGVKYRVFDTPGFEDENNDDRTREILQSIKKVASEIDCLIFVTPLGETRVRSDEKKSIKLISEVFGSEVWQHAVIAFTFSNSKLPSSFEESYDKRTDLIRNEISQSTNNTINKVPSIAIDNETKLTPNGQAWLSNFYMTIFRRISEAGKAPFVLATLDRIENGEIPLSPKQVEEVQKAFGVEEALSIVSIFAPSIGMAAGLLIGGVAAPIIGTGIGVIAFISHINKVNKGKENIGAVYKNLNRK